MKSKNKWKKNKRIVLTKLLRTKLNLVRIEA